MPFTLLKPSNMDTAQEKIALLGAEVMPEVEDACSIELPCGGFEVSFPTTVQSLGFQVEWDDKYPVVGIVKPDSPAACHGIMTGDIIVETNRTCAKSRPREDLMPTFKARPLLLRFQRTTHDKHDDSEEDLSCDASSVEDSTEEGSMVSEHSGSSSVEDSTEETAKLSQWSYPEKSSVGAEHEAPSGRQQVWVTIPEGKTAGSVLSVQAPDGQMVEVDVPLGSGPGRKLCVTLPTCAPSADATPTPKNVNLLTTSVQDVHNEKVWRSRVRMMRDQGMKCTKIGRNGKPYRRRCWCVGGALETNGNSLWANKSSFPVSGIQSVFTGNISEDFRLFAVASKKTSLPSRDRCCVVALEDRTLSFVFDTPLERDFFAETLAFYVFIHDQKTSNQQSDDI